VPVLLAELPAGRATAVRMQAKPCPAQQKSTLVLRVGSALAGSLEQARSRIRRVGHRVSVHTEIGGATTVSMGVYMSTSVRGVRIVTMSV
jgi:hypothetical protein